MKKRVLVILAMISVLLTSVGSSAIPRPSNTEPVGLSNLGRSHDSSNRLSSIDLNALGSESTVSTVPPSTNPQVVLDADSTSQSDVTVSAAATQTKQFAVGVILTGVSTTEWVDDLFAFAFSLTFDPTVLTAQGVTGADTVQFGNNPGCPFAVRIPVSAFPVVIVNNAIGLVQVGYTFIDSQNKVQCDITAPVQLARVNFEIDRAAPSSGTSITLSPLITVADDGHFVYDVDEPLLVDDNVDRINFGTRESVFWDSDGNNALSNGDILISGRSAQAALVPWRDDPRLKFQDLNGNGIWQPLNIPPFVDESVVYDSNNNGRYDVGEPVLDPPTPWWLLSDDPHIKFVDANGDGMLTAGSPVAIGMPFKVLEVVKNNPPIASFTSARPGFVRPGPSVLGFTNVMFDISRSADSEDGFPTGFLMDFGDGLGEQDVTVLPGWNPASHRITYSLPCDASTAPCNFTVTLRVVDSQGATGAAREACCQTVLDDDQPSHAAYSISIAARPRPQPSS